jgi:hypothetical protein
MKKENLATADDLEFFEKSIPQPIEKSSQNQENFSSADDEEVNFFKESQQAPKKESVSLLESEKNAVTRGALRAEASWIDRIRQALQPGGLEEDVRSMSLRPEEKKDIQKKLAPSNLEDQVKLEEELKERYPVQEGRIGEYTEKFAELAPTAFVGPEGFIGKVARTGAATVLSTEAKKAGYPEPVQGLAELAAYGFPDLQRMIPSSNQRQQVLFNFMRSMGMTEEQIAPLAHGDNWFTRSLMRFAKKTGSLEDSLRGTQRGLGAIFDQLSISPEAQRVLTPRQRITFLNQASQTVHNLPHNLRMEIYQDAMDLAQGPFTGSRLLNFYQDVSHTIHRLEGPRGRRLVGVQNDIIDAISSASPQLGNEIRMTNELYSRYANLRERLRPGAFDSLLSSAKVIGALGSLMTGNYKQFAILVGTEQAKAIAAKFLTEPRLANLQVRLTHALNNNRIPLANTIIKEFSEALQKDFPEFSKELENSKINDQKPSARQSKQQ